MKAVTAARWILRKIGEWNLFESRATVLNPFHLRTAIISTRFYIFLLTIAVMTLAMFTALSSQIQTVVIRHPPQAVFEELHSQYSNTLQCPCNRIDIPYGTFIEASYKLHPVCSSVFVSKTWINLLFSPQIGYYFPMDFRSSAMGQFQLLSTLCSFANRTIQDAIDDLLSDTLLSPQVLTAKSLDVQSQTQHMFWRTSTTNGFRRLLDLVRSTTHSNSLQPSLQTTKMHLLHVFPNGSIDAYPLDTIWALNRSTECFCGSTRNCSLPSGFFSRFAYESEGYFALPRSSLANVTGFKVSCYALESLHQSTLECFFNSACLNIVLRYFPLSNNTRIYALDINQTQYAPNTSIEILVNNLFIENWFSNSLFSVYYLQCAPISCTYKFTEKKSALHVLTILLGLYGGLTTALRLCVPLVIRWWRKRNLQTNPNAH
ncbi:unnamed protein product [Rotaria sp. Silwood2]|nr:unnamed protein product [Rotaria sp. Silwood2]